MCSSKDRDKTSDNDSYRTLMLCYKPELIRHVKELQSGDYANQEISNILFKMGYTNSKGKAYHRAQITDFFRQSKKSV